LAGTPQANPMYKASDKLMVFSVLPDFWHTPETKGLLL
jgi:hypothetical protein